MGDLSKNFSRVEFQCRCGKCKSIAPKQELIEKLEEIRTFIGSPIHILSGVRCSEHNNNVDGVKHSQHLLGTAADIVCKELTPTELANIIDDLWPNNFGLGRYKTFTHFDVRTSRARW